MSIHAYASLNLLDPPWQYRLSIHKEIQSNLTAMITAYHIIDKNDMYFTPLQRTDEMTNTYILSVLGTNTSALHNQFFVSKLHTVQSSTCLEHKSNRWGYHCGKFKRCQNCANLIVSLSDETWRFFWGNSLNFPLGLIHFIFLFLFFIPF